MEMLVNMDLLAFNTMYWNGNYFGASTFQQLAPHEKSIGAVVVTANRCAFDKI
jgi:hypothetical protein